MWEKRELFAGGCVSVGVRNNHESRRGLWWAVFG